MESKNLTVFYALRKLPQISSPFLHSLPPYALHPIRIHPKPGLRAIKEQALHSSPTSTHIYLHLHRERQEAEIRDIERETMAPTEKETPSVRRLHIAGLTNPSLTHQDLTNRFSSFGVVHGLEGVGPDGNGFPRSFVYMNLSTTPSQLQRVTSILTGSTWKGMVLRIQEAKPSYASRLETERAVLQGLTDGLTDKEREKKKERERKRRKAMKEKGGIVPVKLSRGVQGVERKDMQVVDVEKAKIKKHWHVTPLGHLIHPVVLKPSHPIPRPSLPRPTSDLPADLAPDSNTTPLKRKSSSGRKSADPPKRARTVVIDPRRYARSHLGEQMLGDPEADERSGNRSHWVCEEVDGEHGVVRWIHVDQRQSQVQSDEEKVVVGRQERLKLLLDLISEETGPDGREPSRWDTVEPSQPTKLARAENDLSNGKSQDSFNDKDGDYDEEDEEEEEDDWIPLGEDVDREEQKGSLLRDSSSPEPTMEPLMSDGGESSTDEDIGDDDNDDSNNNNNDNDKQPTKDASASISTSKPSTNPSPASAPASKPASVPKTDPKQPVGLPLMIDKADPLYHQIAQEKKQGLNVLSSLGFSFDEDEDDEVVDTKQKSRLSMDGQKGTLSFESDDDDDEDTSLAPKKVVLPWDDDDDDDDDLAEEESHVAVPPINKEVKRPVKPMANQGLIPLPEARRDEGMDEVEKKVSFVLSSPSEDNVEEDEEEEEEEEESEEEELDPIELAMRELRGWDDPEEVEEKEEQVIHGGDVMRLRGGAGDDVDMEDEEERKVKVKVNQLKGLFAPSAEETTSFSLGLDLDIDAEAEDPTLTASLPTPAPLAPSSSTSHHRSTTLASQQTSSQAPATTSFRPDTEVPYFFPFLHLEQAERAKGPKVQAKSILELESGKPRPVPGFWRVDTEEQAQQRWETEHLELTREYKRRHREARKRRKRRGGAEDDDEEEEEKE